MITVARAFSQVPVAVLEAPWVQTLWSFWTLRDVERIDALETDARDLTTAFRMAKAYHDPKQLSDEAGTHPTAVAALPSHADAKAHGARIITAARAAGWIPTANPTDSPTTPDEVSHA